MKNPFSKPTLVFVTSLLLGGTGFAQRQMEKLGRGLVVLKTSTSQTYLGWRLLATDPDDVTFNVYRSISGGGATKLNASPLMATTDFTDTTVGSTNLASFPVSYDVRPVIGGVEQAASPSYTVPAAALTKQFVPMPLQPVAGGAYAPYDVKFCWVGDFDGDGEYDYLVDRLSTTTAANQYLQAYKRDGTFLWQMDMGPNSVNQYAYEPGSSAISIGDTDNVTVYDMDGDGKAEVLVRTANGVTVTNAVGTQVATITAGNETTQFVSVINGLSGAELARTTLPNPWAVYGTLTSKCAIAYLDGVRPSVVFYGYNRDDAGTGNFYRVFNAFDFRDGALTVRWTTPQWGGEGHQIRVADVDHDGKDEICDLGFTIDDDGSMLFDNSELHHGDRFHTADMDPDRPGLETFIIQQNNTSLLSTAYYESATGKMIRRQYNSNVVDVGRGDAGDFNQNHLGMEMFSTQPGMWGAKGNLISQPTGQPVFPTLGLWWDADYLREFMSGANGPLTTPTIDKWVVNATYPDGANARQFSLYADSFISAGGTAAVSSHQAYGGRPGIIADLFGDWREESIQIANDYNELRIYTTKNVATSRLNCLMQNAAYRMQATTKGYYQSNFTDYYLGTGMQAPAPALLSDASLVWKGDGVSNVWDASTPNWSQSWFQTGTFNTPSTYADGQTVLFDITGSNNIAVDLTGTLTPASVMVNTPKPYTFGGSGVLSGPMKLTKSGGGALTLTGIHDYTGATLIAEGALVVNGSLTNSPVTVRGGVWLDGAISGTGTVGNGAVIQPRGSVSPGNGTNSIGTLTISGSLSETDAYNRLDLSNSPGGSNDLIAVQGNLSLSGTNILQINPTSGTLAAGTYTLITYTGTLTGGTANLTVRGLAGVPYSITAGAGSVNLVVNPLRTPGAITWAGTNGTWNLAATANWLKSGAADVFVTGDAVTFDNTGTAAATATLADAMLPASVSVNSTANYTFAGSGYLSGTMGLMKSGAGTLTINTSNDFTGPVSITGGVLAVSTVSEAGAPGGLGAATTAASNLSINGGTLRFTGTQSVTDRGVTIGAGGATFDTPTTSNLLVWKGLLSGSGPFTKTGAGTLILNGTNTYTGATTISGGTIALADDTTNRYGLGNGGTGTITISNGTLKMFDDDGSYNATYWNINVPASSTATLLADGRCELRGALTGSGTFNFYIPFIRTDLFGNWSAFTGQINVTTDADGGDFRIQNTAGYGNASINLADIYMYYTPTMSGNLTINIGALTGAATSGISGGPTAGRILTWSVGAKNLDTTFAGAISNGTSTTALTKVGTGALTLSGTSTYTGATAVSGGALAVTGVLGATNVTVASGAKLTGSGSIGGLVTVQSGGTLGVGTGSPATLGIAGGLALSGGSNLVMKLGSTTTAGGGVNDLVQMTAGTLSLSGTITVTPAYLNGTLIPGTYTLITGGAATTGTPTFVWGGTNGEVVSFSTSTPGTVTLVVAGAGPPAVPTGLVATAGNTQVTLNWDAVAGATGYTVKRSLTSGSGYAPMPGGTTANTSFTDTGLTNGTTYYYKVCATNGFGDGPDSSEAGATPASTVTTTFISVAAQDGYIRESNETSNVGGSTTSNSTLRMGDDNSTQSGERQLKGFVSFDTSSLPDNAIVTSATLKLKSSAITGTSPFTTHGTCYADIKGGLGFGEATALANGDFEAAADATSVAVMSNPVSVGGISSGTLNAAARGWINKTATTQLRLYFSTDDNDNNADDWIDFYAGEDATAANRPVLELTYQLDGTSQLPTTLTVSPPGSTLAVNATQAFSATVLDQFGNPMSATIAWSAIGGGTINASGLFTATAAGGPYQITATSGSLSTGVPVTVTKGTPTVSVAPTASSITYGQALSSSTLTGGTASVAGSFAFTSSGTTPNAGTAAQAVTFTPTDSANYNTVGTTSTVTVIKATSTVSVAPTASSITYGQALSGSTLTGGTASVAGSFAFTTSGTTPNAGTASQAVTFTPTDSANYATAATSASVTVNKATPTVSVVPTASAIIYGQALSSSLLSGGSASVAGSFAFTTPATIPDVGTASQAVTFTPTATANYNTVAAAVSVTVNEGTAIYQVTNVYSGDGSEDVLFQNADGSLLNGGIVAIGSFPADYNIPSTASPADIASAVASFTPLASAPCGGDSVSLGGSFPGYVEGASLAGVNPSSLIGRPLYVFVGNASTLAASTSIAIRQMDEFRPNNPPAAVHYGSYLVNLISSAPAPRIGNVGTFTGLAWQWGEISTYQTLQLTGPSSATITTPPTASPITYGQSLASSTLSGGVGSVPGSFAFTAPSAMPGAGTASQEFTFTPTDTVTYATVTGMASVTVNKATAPVTLGDLAATYDGTPHPVSATTTPAGLTVLLTYNGSATAPTVPGTYPVLADIADANHSGSAVDSLVIAARSLEYWVTGKFSPAQIAAGESAMTADPDHDGLTNLAEYALGGDPYAFTAQPAMTSDATSMSITFQRPAWIGDVIYQAEAGDNFTSWAALTLEVLNPGSDPETVRATHTFPVSKPDKTFLRLRFEK